MEIPRTSSSGNSTTLKSMVSSVDGVATTNAVLEPEPGVPHTHKSGPEEETKLHSPKISEWPALNGKFWLLLVGVANVVALILAVGVIILGVKVSNSNAVATKSGENGSFQPPVMVVGQLGFAPLPVLFALPLDGFQDIPTVVLQVAPRVKKQFRVSAITRHEDQKVVELLFGNDVRLVATPSQAVLYGRNGIVTSQWNFDELWEAAAEEYLQKRSGVVDDSVLVVSDESSSHNMDNHVAPTTTHDSYPLVNPNFSFDGPTWGLPDSQIEDGDLILEGQPSPRDNTVVESATLSDDIIPTINSEESLPQIDRPQTTGSNAAEDNSPHVVNSNNNNNNNQNSSTVRPQRRRLLDATTTDNFKTNVLDGTVKLSGKVADILKTVGGAFVAPTVEFSMSHPLGRLVRPVFGSYLDSDMTMNVHTHPLIGVHSHPVSDEDEPHSHSHSDSHSHRLRR